MIYHWEVISSFEESLLSIISVEAYYSSHTILLLFSGGSSEKVRLFWHVTLYFFTMSQGKSSCSTLKGVPSSSIAFRSVVELSRNPMIKVSDETYHVLCVDVYHHTYPCMTFTLSLCYDERNLWIFGCLIHQRSVSGDGWKQRRSEGE